MTRIILDISANTTKNDNKYIERMIDEIKAIDTGKHEIIFKAQLFEKAGNNVVMNTDHFSHMFWHCKKYGYKCTASVFDMASLLYLIKNFNVPFVKIANNKDLYWITGEVPRKIPLYISSDSLYEFEAPDVNSEILFCISKYPADIKDYEENKYFNKNQNISDHTKDLELFKKYNPKIIEFHYALKDSTGLDAESGVCKTPEVLKEIL